VYKFTYIVAIQKDQVLRGTSNCQKVVKYNTLVPNKHDVYSTDVSGLALLQCYVEF